ncbi:MAG: hypothetical protein AAFR79_05600 [Pseudomonadota bacterium]
MRPLSVRAFEALILLSLAIGLTVTALTWADLTREVGPGLVLLVQGATVLVVLGGVFLVARRGSNIARWAVTVMFGIGFIAYIPQVAFLFSGQPTVGLLGAVQVMLQLSAVLMLFRPDAKLWFRNRRSEGEA